MLARDPRVLAHLTTDSLRAVLAPEAHLGQAGALTDAAVARADAALVGTRP